MVFIPSHESMTNSSIHLGEVYVVTVTYMSLVYYALLVEEWFSFWFV